MSIILLHFSEMRLPRASRFFSHYVANIVFVPFYVFLEWVWNAEYIYTFLKYINTFSLARVH